uniref:cysteine desulfurase n=1 Tax=Corethron hystrix TaxID=216773 RepID=A0A7S1BZ23_9STRA|mmetsp:Transcript_5857/g.12415  ORF Transcript_5857/g.12415 Transcript_5857/m.12415 type:complete len:398 (+) Transcript_5857:433-1626(+)
MGQCTSKTVEVDRKGRDSATPELEKVDGSELSSVDDAWSLSSDNSNRSITSNNIIYLDNNATTPIDPRVYDAMKPFLTREFGNPSAKGYRHGWDARRAVDAARRQVAELINCAPSEVVFTSGATESDAMALLGTFEALDKSRGAHLITSLMEHSAVLEAAKKLETTYDDVDVTYLSVRAEDEGVTTASSVEAALRDDTKMVSVMMVNNEIGVINEIEAIGKLCTERGILFHVDACQGLGKVPLDVKRFGIDMLSVSAHKIYGPKGCGAFFIAERDKQFFSPLLRGGGQEFGLRGGTHNVPGIVGFGEACRIAKHELENTDECFRLRKLRDTLYHTLKDGVKEIVVNGSLDPSRRVPSNLNVSFPGVEGEALLNKVNTKIALSSGSACTGATGSNHMS